MIRVSILIYPDCSLAVEFPNKVLFIEPQGMNKNKICRTALLIAAILEFIGAFSVRILAFSDDAVGNACIEYYKDLKEKGQLLNPIATAKENND